MRNEGRHSLIKRRVAQGYYTRGGFLGWWRGSALKEDTLFCLRDVNRDSALKEGTLYGLGDVNKDSSPFAWVVDSTDYRHQLFLAYFDYFLKNQQRDKAQITAEAKILNVCSQFAAAHRDIFLEVISYALQNNQIPTLIKDLVSPEGNFWLRKLILSGIDQNHFLQWISEVLRNRVPEECYVLCLTEAVNSITAEELLPQKDGFLQHLSTSRPLPAFISYLLEKGLLDRDKYSRFSHQEKEIFLYQLRSAQNREVFLKQLMDQASWQHQFFSCGIDDNDRFALHKKILNWMAQYADTVSFNNFIDVSLQNIDLNSCDKVVSDYLKTIVKVTLCYQSPIALANLFEKKRVPESMLPMLAGQRANMHYQQVQGNITNKDDSVLNRFLTPLKNRYPRVLQESGNGVNGTKYSVVVSKSPITRFFLYAALVIFVEIPLAILRMAVHSIVSLVSLGMIDFEENPDILPDAFSWVPFAPKKNRAVPGRYSANADDSAERKMVEYFANQEFKHIGYFESAGQRLIDDRTAGVKLPAGRLSSDVSQENSLRFFGTKQQRGEEYRKMREKLAPNHSTKCETARMSVQSAMVDARLFVQGKQDRKRRKFNEVFTHLKTLFTGLKFFPLDNLDDSRQRGYFITLAKDEIKKFKGSPIEKKQAQQWLNIAQKQHTKLCALEKINETPAASHG